MADTYKLMHKDELCGVLTLDEDMGQLIEYKNLSRNAPYLGNADTRLMRRWWEARAIPASRTAMQEIIRLAGCNSNKDYLAKNLALSMTDTYWICPIEMELHWSDVNLHNLHGFMNGKMPYHNETSYDPNASLGGQMDKYWDLSTDPPTLIKTAYREYGQQAINEAFASLLHERQETIFPYVRYRLRQGVDNGIQTVCDAFTTDQKELVSAMEILDSRKIPNDLSLYDAFIMISAEHGIDKEYMRDFMDYLTMTDFIISNTDEHLMNYGVIRSVERNLFISPAPIFDSGNSMFYSDHREKAFSRAELLERKITAIHNTEEAMLRHVTNRGLVKFDLLPSPEEVLAFYQSRGIPEQKALFISQSYYNKLSLFRDFQQGKNISLYFEKKIHGT